MTIGIDVSDTLIDVWHTLMDLSMKNTNNKMPSDVTGLYLPKDIFNLSESEDELIWEKFFNLPIEKFLITDCSLLNKLSEHAMIVLITGKNNSNYYNFEKRAVDYISKNGYFFNESFFQVISKGEYCKKNGINILIDDSVRNCEDAIIYGIKCFLVNKEYNINRNISPSITRIDNLKEFYDTYYQKLCVIYGATNENN